MTRLQFHPKWFTLTPMGHPALEDGRANLVTFSSLPCTDEEIAATVHKLSFEMANALGHNNPWRAAVGIAGLYKRLDILDRMEAQSPIIALTLASLAKAKTPKDDITGVCEGLLESLSDKLAFQPALSEIINRVPQMTRETLRQNAIFMRPSTERLLCG